MASEEMDRLYEHLRRIGLRHAAQNLDEHIRQAAALKLGHLAFIARIAEAEVLARKETGTQKRISQADFPEICRLEDYDFKKQPSLDRKQVLDLAELGFVDRRQAVLWIGPSGVGKTHLAVSLGVRACQAGYRVRFCRAYELLTRLYASLADDTLDQILDEMCKPDLLIVDELGNSPRKREHDFAGVFFELVARRYRRGFDHPRHQPRLRGVATGARQSLPGHTRPRPPHRGRAHLHLPQRRQELPRRSRLVPRPTAAEARSTSLRPSRPPRRRPEAPGAIVSSRPAAPPPRIVTLVLPALGPREAGALIDCLEQLQGELWQVYREAILQPEPDPDVAEDPASNSDPPSYDPDDSLF